MGQLAQISELQTERARAMLAMLLEFAPFIRFMEANGGFELDATDYDWRPVDPSATIKTRAIGGEYDPTDVTPGAKQTGALAFHGESVDIDETHKADARRTLRGIDDWLDKELTRRGRSWARKYDVQLINGTGAGNPAQIKGLIKILDGVTDLPGFAGEKGVIDAATFTAGADTSIDLSDSNNWATWIEKLMLSIQKVPGAKGLLMNDELYARMYTIAQQKHILGEARDSFGVPVATFNRIPMVPMTIGAILNTEPDNAGAPNADTTSLYIVRPGEQDFSLVTNSGLEFDDEFDLEKKESERIKWEIRGQFKVEEKDAIRRVRNIKLG